MLQQAGPWAAYAALRDHHLPRMPADLKFVLLRRAWGDDLDAIAQRGNFSEDTAKRHLREALNAVFDTRPESVRRDGYAAATWVNAHLVCCLVDELAQLRTEAMP